MSRPLRIEYAHAWYHVLNRGRRRESIFRDTKDYEIFLQTVQEAANSGIFASPPIVSWPATITSWSRPRTAISPDASGMTGSIPKDSIAAMATMVPYSGGGIRLSLSKPIRIFFSLFVIFIETRLRRDWRRPWMITPGPAIKATSPGIPGGNGYIKTLFWRYLLPIRRKGLKPTGNLW